jgi:hypothetical protein
MLLMRISEQILSWTMDDFIHWPKPYPLLSATCDEISSWMNQIWMENHLVSDNNYNIVNLYSPKNLQGMTNNVVFTFSVGDNITLWFTISIEQDN